MITYTILTRTNETKIIKGYNLPHALAMKGLNLKDIKNWDYGY